MSSFFGQMGIWLYPLLLGALFLLGQIILAGRTVGRGDPAQAARANNTVLAWGALNGALGILGTLVGFSLAAGAIEGAGSISPPIVWGGVKVALSTSVFGLLLLALALVAWLVLRFLEARSAGPTA